MAALPGRLGQLLAGDIMTKSVIVLRVGDSVPAAVEKLKSNHITGAPVVDEQQKLVGILSISDLINPDAEAPHSAAGSEAPALDRDSTTWELFERAGSLAEEHAGQTVADRMSDRVTSVRQSESLVEVARAMCDGHWHRVPVVDASGALKGIISTMDVLAAVVNAADEADR